jgi:hypothetical protein
MMMCYEITSFDINISYSSGGDLKSKAYVGKDSEYSTAALEMTIFKSRFNLSHSRSLLHCDLFQVNCMPRAYK